MLAAACICAVAAPVAHAASVTVQKLDGPSQSFELGELTTDVDRPYIVRDSSGEREVAVKGTSLTTLLREANADTVSVGSIEISGGGAKVVLDPDQLSGAGGGSPVIYADGARAAFLRPAYSSDDANGNDRIAAPNLTVRLLRGTFLKVEGRASDTSVKVGQPVTFTAKASGGAGQSFDYRWNFDDGSRRGSGARTTHRFREEGSYIVLVSATTAQNRAGDFDSVRVRVGPAPKGPDRTGGGTDGSANAPDSGTAAGGDSGVSGGTGSAAEGPARAVPRAGSSRARRPSPSRRPLRASSPAGDPVEGTLLAGGVTPPPEQKPAARQRAARTGNDSAGDGGFGLPRAAWGGLAALALAGAGGLVEWRQPLLRRRGPA